MFVKVSANCVKQEKCIYDLISNVIKDFELEALLVI